MTTLTPGEVGGVLEAVLAEEPRIAAASAYVFGSVAEGRMHRQSDVDVALLLVRAAHPRATDRLEARLRLSARLAGRLGRPVDVVILNDVAPGLGRHVVSRGGPRPLPGCRRGPRLRVGRAAPGGRSRPVPASAPEAEARRLVHA